MRRRLPVFLSTLALLAAGFSGCAATPPGAANTPAVAEGAHAAGAPRWPFWPRGMRVHPLTRLATDPIEGQVIEARIEFVDAQGHMTKAVGTLVLVLVDIAAAADAGEEEVWRIDLTQPAATATWFDDVTRTYLFRLAVDAGHLPAQAELHVQFDSVDGQHMRHSLRLRQ
jgi:hypothetical protein